MQGIIQGQDGIFGVVRGKGQIVEALQGEHTVNELNLHAAALGTAQLTHRKEVKVFEGFGVRVIEEQQLDRIINGAEREFLQPLDDTVMQVWGRDRKSPPFEKEIG